MLIFDQLEKNDPQLRLLALVVLGGMGMLLAGLWWVQIVHARDYQENLETQSYRTVRIPAVRGKIVDRNGNALAENHPAYNVSLYLEELSRQFKTNYAGKAKAAAARLVQQREEMGKTLGRRLTSKEKKQFLLGADLKDSLGRQARYEVASNALTLLSRCLQEPLSLDAADFEHHYEKSLVLPYPVTNNISSVQIARFEEEPDRPQGADLEIQSTRFYPYTNTAAHLLGYLQRDESSIAGEEAFFSYRLPDYRGAIGIEFGYDPELHGRAGEKSVLVNNLGYRHAENIWSPAEPGRNVVLTLDLPIQQAAEKALQSAPIEAPVRGAAVVMDVRTGDVLVLASVPSFNPNVFIPKLSPAENDRLHDPRLRPEINRATQEKYAPGSIFKTVVGLACLEAGLDPKATIYNPGFTYVGRRKIHDLAAPGLYDFRRAIMFSSNTYFITNGMKAGIENIVKLGKRLQLGELIKLPTRQETRGDFPSLERIRAGWSDGDTANLCIGQGYIDVTPLQIAVMTAALANGGKVLQPRLVDRIESQDPASDEPPHVFPRGQVRDELGVSPRNLQILKDAMRDEVEDAGTGARAVVAGLQICGKTGTAQVTNERNQVINHITWFISFAPYDRPRYAVVVMVESGSSGGLTCAPIAAKIYEALLQSERPKPPQNLAQTE